MIKKQLAFLGLFKKIRNSTDFDPKIVFLPPNTLLATRANRETPILNQCLNPDIICDLSFYYSNGLNDLLELQIWLNCVPPLPRV